MLLSENLLFSHLRVADKLGEFPLTEVDYLLRDVLGEINDAQLVVLRRIVLVSKYWVVNDPFLRQGLLRVIKVVLVDIFTETGSEELENHVISSNLFVDDRSVDFVLFGYQNWH